MKKNRNGGGFEKVSDGNSLECSLAGMWMRTPIITASGTFGYGEEYTRLRNFDIESIGAIVLKSVTRFPRQGNPPPRFVETAAGIINSIGLQNVGVEALIANELPKMRQYKTNIVVSIAGNSVEEYDEMSFLLKDTDDYEAIEVNISCPNVEKQGMLFSFDPKSAGVVTETVKKHIKSKPVIMKLSPNAPDLVATAIACSKAGADVISLVNTFSALAIDIEKRRPILRRNFGGLSGPAIKPIALAMVCRVATAFKVQKMDTAVIGMGGILTWEDAIQYILCGASAIAVGTGIFYNPAVIKEIANGMRKYCETNEQKISDVVGSLKLYSDSDSQFC